MKKFLKSLLCSLCALLFCMPSPVLADSSKEIIWKTVIDNADYCTQEGKNLSQYQITTSTTQDGAQINLFSDQDGNAVASMVEDASNLCLAYTDGRMYTFEKDKEGHIDFSNNVEKTLTNIQYPILPREIEAFLMNPFPCIFFLMFTALRIAI